LKKRGHKDLTTISSYLSFQNIQPDLMISSLALRAQVTATELAKKIRYDGKITYMKELYQSSPEIYFNVLSLQDDTYESVFLIGHNPELTEFANIILGENFYKFPTLGVLAIRLKIDSWEDIDENIGEAEFFIQPKQFKYYMPKQIRTNLPKINKEDV